MTAVPPAHFLRKPDAGHRRHQLLQEHLLALVVLEVVADEHQSLHESTLLHLREQQLVGEQLLHVAVQRVKTGLWKGEKSAMVTS